MTTERGAGGPWLNRKKAAEWCQAQGLLHVTVQHLRDLADDGKGPPYSRMSKYTYYAQADLQEWVAAALVPTTRGRGRVTRPAAAGLEAGAPG